ncbi:hypothetical protein HU200_010422 [Digitaria exilis]|uniref:Pentatricopeptide repeat-containing protein n=1 Tax=Digitaria exilis TaxID=1010633 RepID=A0A835KMC8_9POAL|nr:hypothetical protein HU200_010422 [Digitaria exilis]
MRASSSSAPSYGVPEPLNVHVRRKGVQRVDPGDDDAGRVSRAVHALAVRTGVDLDVFVGDALVAFYARCGDVATSRKVFDAVTAKDVVTWNSMIRRVRSERAVGRGGHAAARPDLPAGVPDPVTLIAACTASAAVAKRRRPVGAFTHR